MIRAMLLVIDAFKATSPLLSIFTLSLACHSLYLIEVFSPSFRSSSLSLHLHVDRVIWPQDSPGPFIHFQNLLNSILLHTNSVQHPEHSFASTTFNSRPVLETWLNTHLHTVPMETMAMTEALKANTINGNLEHLTRFMTTIQTFTPVIQPAAIVARSDTN